MVIKIKMVFEETANDQTSRGKKKNVALAERIIR
jgi:hypothetical protein